jgi:hypothetical protein
MERRSLTGGVDYPLDSVYSSDTTMTTTHHCLPTPERRSVAYEEWDQSSHSPRSPLPKIQQTLTLPPHPLSQSLPYPYTIELHLPSGHSPSTNASVCRSGGREVRRVPELYM